MQEMVIDRLGHQGDGIARGPVYVPGALPGEVVAGEVADGVMAAPRIVTPVPERVRAPCRHAGGCGGCQVQQAADDFVARWKRDVVVRALSAQGIDVAVGPTLTSPGGSRRRAGFSARRTKKGALAGFHRKGSEEIVAVPDCVLVRPALRAALPLIEDLAVLGASRKAELSVHVTESAAGLDVVVRGGKAVDPALQMGLAELARRHDLARLAWDGGEVLTRRAPVQRLGSASVVPPPGAFLQATAEGQTALTEAVLRAVGPAKRVLDLFSGCGTFSLPLAARAEVLAVEAERDMLEALDAGWRHAPGLRRIRTEARDLFRNPLLPEDMKGFDAAVLDPPRAGAEAQVAELARARLPRIAHVSCNPVSFARDTATFVRAGYVVDWVSPVDQFRWSSHVEIVAGLHFEG